MPGRYQRMGGPESLEQLRRLLRRGPIVGLIKRQQTLERQVTRLRESNRHWDPGLQSASAGANPRRKQFSVITLGTRKFWRYSRSPALVPPPDILNPPKGCRSTIA